MISKNIRIKDIARLAGVSVGTVDRVLHNRGRVSKEALDKVTTVLNQIEYRPNLIARTLSTNKVHRIATLIPDPRQDPYWAQSSVGMNQALADWAQYGVVGEPFLFDLYDSDSFKREALAAYHARPDGILMAPIFYQEALSCFELYKANDIPYILFNTNIPEIEPLSFIGQDLYRSGRVSAELMHLGHPDGGELAVLHIHEDLHNAVHLLEKERGFREYFEDLGSKDHEIKTLSLGDPTESVFQEKLRTLLAGPRLTGIFVSTSKASFVAPLLETINPDITLIGYDLLDENLRYLRSGTIDFLINQNPSRQASFGISLLANHLVFKKETPATHLFPLEILTKENIESYIHSSAH